MAQCVDCERTQERQLFEPPEFGSLIKIKPMRSASETIAHSAPNRCRNRRGSRPIRDIFHRSLFATTRSVHGCVSGHALCRRQPCEHDGPRRRTPPDRARLCRRARIKAAPAANLRADYHGVRRGFAAYTDNDSRLRRALPPRPPRLHSRVYPCTNQETIALTEDLQFMRRILNGSVKMEASASDLCAAIVRHAWAARAFAPAYLHQAGLQLSALLGSDYEALQTILTSVVG